MCKVGWTRTFGKGSTTASEKNESLKMVVAVGLWADERIMVVVAVVAGCAMTDGKSD
jgi:hypothetical protein